MTQSPVSNSNTSRATISRSFRNSTFANAKLAAQSFDLRLVELNSASTDTRITCFGTPPSLWPRNVACHFHFIKANTAFHAAQRPYECGKTSLWALQVWRRSLLGQKYLLSSRLLDAAHGWPFTTCRFPNNHPRRYLDRVAEQCCRTRIMASADRSWKMHS